jgi:hypothetical protein
MRPFFMQAHGQALRSFIDEVNNSESPFHKHPEDYSLFFVGEFDETGAVLTPAELKCLARGHEVKESLD